MAITKEMEGELAFRVAITEIIQRMIAENLYDMDPNVFARRVRSLQEGVVKSVSSRKHFSGLSGMDESDIDQQATKMITNIFSGIKQPR